MKRCPECRRAAHAGHLPTCSQSVARQRITPASKKVEPLLTDKFISGLKSELAAKATVEISEAIGRRYRTMLSNMMFGTGSLDIMPHEYDDRRFFPVNASNKPTTPEDDVFRTLTKLMREMQPHKLTFWSLSTWPSTSFLRITAPHAEPNETIFLGHPDIWRDERFELSKRMPNLLTDIPITNIEQDGPERDRFLEIFKNAFGQSSPLFSSPDFPWPMRDD